MKVSLLRKKSACLALTSIAAIALTAGNQLHAAVLASENFNSYGQNNWSANSWNGGTGWSGAWTNTATDGYLPGIGSDGRLHTEGSVGNTTRHKGVLRSLSTTYNTSTTSTMWGSVSMSISNSGESGEYAYISFMNGGSEAFRFGRSGGEHAGFWGIEQGNVPGVALTNAPVVLGDIVTLLFKIEYDGTNTIFSLWVNPTATAEGDLGTADATLSRNATFSFNGIRMQSRSNGTFDDFTLATTFAEAIPEPSSALLCILSSSLLLIRKRRIG